MSHTERIHEDEEDLENLKSQIDQIAQLKEDYQSQQQQISELNKIIAKLQGQNQCLKQKHYIPPKSQTFQFSTGEFGPQSLRNEKTYFPNNLRLLSPQFHTSSSKSSSNLVRTQETLDVKSNEHHYRNKDKLIENFIDDLKYEIDEKDSKLAREMREHERTKKKYKKSKKQNEKLNFLNESCLQENKMLIEENEMLKQQIRMDQELKCKYEMKIQEIRKKEEREEVQFMLMDKIYEDFQNMLHS